MSGPNYTIENTNLSEVLQLEEKPITVEAQAKIDRMLSIHFNKYRSPQFGWKNIKRGLRREARIAKYLKKQQKANASK